MTSGDPTHETIRDVILQHLLSALDRTPVHEHPFSHFYLEHAFPQSVYARMLDNFPAFQLYRPGRAEKHMREDGVNTKGSFPLINETLQQLSQIQRELWGAVSEALSSDVLQERVFCMLRNDLSRRFRVKPAQVHAIKAFPRSSLIRNLSGYEIPPHPDGSSKIVTMQFYLARDLTQVDLGTALYERHLFRWKTFLSPRDRFEKVKQFPFKPNCGYGFAVSHRSFHGRERIPTHSQVRNTLLHIYFDSEDKLAS